MSRFEGLVTLEPWGLAVVSETVVVDETAVAALPERGPVPLAARKAVRWQASYIRTAVLVDVFCMLIAASVAVNVRFSGPSNRPAAYLAITFALPLLWGVTVRLCGAYDPKLIGVGSDEFRRVLNAGICLTAAVAIASYVTNLQLARIYVAIALPTATVLDLFARYWLRKRLHTRRGRGYGMQRVVAVGHPELGRQFDIRTRPVAQSRPFRSGCLPHRRHYVLSSDRRRPCRRGR